MDPIIRWRSSSLMFEPDGRQRPFLKRYSEYPFTNEGHDLNTG